MKTSRFITLFAAAATFFLTSCGEKVSITPEGLTSPNDHATAKLVAPTDNSDDRIPPKSNPDRAIPAYETPSSNFNALPESEEKKDPFQSKTPGYNPQGEYEQVGDPSTFGGESGEAQEEADKEAPVSTLKVRRIISRSEVESTGNTDKDPDIDPFMR